jgi:hypothetical protein
MLERMVIGSLITFGGCAAPAPTPPPAREFATGAAGEQLRGPNEPVLAKRFVAADRDACGAPRSPGPDDARVFRQRGAFDAAAGRPPLVVDFDDLAAGANVEDLALPARRRSARSASTRRTTTTSARTRTSASTRSPSRPRRRRAPPTSIATGASARWTCASSPPSGGRRSAVRRRRRRARGALATSTADHRVDGEDLLMVLAHDGW